MFNEAIQKSCALSSQPLATDRKPVKSGKDFQLQIGSATNIISPVYSIAAQPNTQRNDPDNPYASLSIYH